MLSEDRKNTERTRRGGPVGQGASSLIAVLLFSLFWAGMTTVLIRVHRFFFLPWEDEDYELEVLVGVAEIGCVVLMSYWASRCVYRVLAGPMLEYKDDCCDRCFYNLTGNVSGICPECGATISSKQRSKIENP